MSRTLSPKKMFEIQLTRGYYEEYFRITEPMFVKPREAKWYKTAENYIFTK
jgi:hypothetical protein